MHRKPSAGWSVAGQEEVTVTRVSMPGKGLPKLTGLKHELADPHLL